MRALEAAPHLIREALIRQALAEREDWLGDGMCTREGGMRRECVADLIDDAFPDRWDPDYRDRDPVARRFRRADTPYAPWCAFSMNALIKREFFDWSPFGNTGSVPAMVRIAKKGRYGVQWISRDQIPAAGGAQPGDLFVEADIIEQSPTHIGLVWQSTGENSFRTLEGNYSSRFGSFRRTIDPELFSDGIDDGLYEYERGDTYVYGLIRFGGNVCQ